MPVTAYYDHKHKGLLTDNFGIVTGEEIVNSVQNHFTYPFFSELNYWIIERTNCTSFNVTQSDIKKVRNLISIAANKNRDIYHALVSPSDITYGMSRMYQTLANDQCFITEVFHTREEADAWIEEKLQIKLDHNDYKQL